MKGVFQISTRRGLVGATRDFCGTAASIRFACCSVSWAIDAAAPRRTAANAVRDPLCNMIIPLPQSDQPSRYSLWSASLASGRFVTFMAMGSYSMVLPKSVATFPRSTNSVSGPL